MSIGLNPWKQHVPLWFAAWALVLALLAGYWAGSFARPPQDRWHFDRFHIGQIDMLVRIDRYSGKAEFLLPNGDWHGPMPSQVPAYPKFPVSQ